jgi:hypothetical protein
MYVLLQNSYLEKPKIVPVEGEHPTGYPMSILFLHALAIAQEGVRRVSPPLISIYIFYI